MNESFYAPKQDKNDDLSMQITSLRNGRLVVDLNCMFYEGQTTTHISDSSNSLAMRFITKDYIAGQHKISGDI